MDYNGFVTNISSANQPVCKEDTSGKNIFGQGDVIVSGEHKYGVFFWIHMNGGPIKGGELKIISAENPQEAYVYVCECISLK